MDPCNDMILRREFEILNSTMQRNDQTTEKSNFKFFKIFRIFRSQNVKNVPDGPGEKSTKFKFGSTKLKLYEGIFAPSLKLKKWYANFQKYDLISHICGRPPESRLRLVCKFAEA